MVNESILKKELANYKKDFPTRWPHEKFLELVKRKATVKQKSSEISECMEGYQC